MATRARAALGELGAHVTETIQGMPELLAFGARERRREAFMALVRRYQGLRLELLGDLARQSERLELATGLGGLIVALLGAKLAVDGVVDPALVPLFILISVAAFLPVSEIAQVSRQLADTIASTRRLEVIESEPVRITDGALDPQAPRGGMSVRFEHVRFAYPGRSKPALSDVSFEVPAGSTVALVGSSGAGKTTIANLLLRFWDPDAGVVRLDGHDLREYELDDLRRRIALVAQDTYLFNDTLRSNILLARPGASAEELLAAVDKAALDDFVASLPEGLETVVGERGAQLSGGQRQRLAIARAMLKDAPILLLDEATSALDSESERQVQVALRALMHGCTTVVIAHRLSTIIGADLICVMDQGHIVETGRHAQLLARNGLYARLYETQFATEREPAPAVVGAIGS